MRVRHPRLAAVVVALSLLVLSSGCAPETAPLAVPKVDVVVDGPVIPVVSRDVLIPGEAVDVVFHNTVSETYWFNPCERQLERKVGDAWVSLGEDFRLCTAMAYILNPSSQRTELVDVPPMLEPGVYRFVFSMRAASATDVVLRPASSAFEVK